MKISKSFRENFTSETICVTTAEMEDPKKRKASEAEIEVADPSHEKKQKSNTSYEK
jgi:hypothetical protein